MSHSMTIHLRPFGRAVPGRDIAPLIEELLSLIKRNRRHDHGGTYVLADCNGDVFAVAEDSACAREVMRKLRRMIVGLYGDIIATTYADAHTAEFASKLYPTPEKLCSDLMEHFINIGFINDPRLPLTLSTP